MKVECFFVSGLAMLQACVLLGVSEKEFDLEPC